MNGAQKTGEMEKDAWMEHGASACTLERLCLASDVFWMIHCLACGAVHRRATVNEQTDECFVCHAKGNFCRVKTPYATKLLMDLLIGAGFIITKRLTLNPTAKLSFMKPAKAAVAPAAPPADDDDEEDDDEDAEDSLMKKTAALALFSKCLRVELGPTGPRGASRRTDCMNQRGRLTPTIPQQSDDFQTVINRFNLRSCCPSRWCVRNKRISIGFENAVIARWRKTCH